MRRTVFVFFAIVTLTGCDQFTWFQSEKSVSKKLTGTWKRIFLDIRDYDEEWQFADGTLGIFQGKPPNPLVVTEEGSYKVSTSLFNAFIKVEGFADTSSAFNSNEPPVIYNQKWTIIELDEKILYIVADHPSGGISQREFVKKQ